MDTRVEGAKVMGDVPIVREFPDVFPKDFSGVPPERQVEFRINLINNVAPIAKAPHCLASPEMQELSMQLQKLLDKGFSSLSSSP